jgi:molybdopterin-guanine dinucleotide biosynthesis protein A
MDVVGAVLAGGAGSRLGGSKAAAPLGGRPLLSYPLAALRAAVGEVAVVAKADTELPAVGYGVLIWREPDEPRHPLAGIVEALRRAEGRPVVVLACDLPFVTAELVRELVNADAGDAPAIVATTYERGLQPLCARYEHAAFELLAGFDPDAPAIAQVQALRPLTLTVDADLLRNVNTAADPAAAETELTRR